MEIHVSLQPRILIKLSFRALAAHFQDLIRRNPAVEQVNHSNSRLAHLVHIEAIPPAIYSVWLHIAVRASPKLLQTAILDPESCGVRHAAIEVLSHIFRGSRWKQVGWDALGGARGILHLLNQLSLAEVRSALVAMRGCAHKPDRKEVARCMEELVTGLNHDDEKMSRPLAPHAKLMIPLCSSEFVLRFLNTQSTEAGSASLLDRILGLHIDLVRRIVVGSVEVPRFTRIDIISRLATKLLVSREPYTPVQYEATAVDVKVPGLALSKDLLYTIQRDPELKVSIKWHIPEWIENTVTMLLRRKTSFDHILHFLQLAFPTYLESVVSSALGRPLVALLIQCWSIAGFDSATGHHKNLARSSGKFAPESQPKKEHKGTLESILATVLRDHPDSRLGAKRDRDGFLRGVLQKVAPRGRLELLKIICKHTTALGCDLDVFPPSERETKTVPGWSPTVLQLFPVEDAKCLFARSLAIYGCEELVPEPGAASDGSYCLDWVAQCKMKARWESLEPPAEDDFAFTRKVIREAQHRAERDRTPEGRLKWARAALSLACESKSIFVFHEVVKWVKRFLRDWSVFSPLMEEVQSSGQVLSCASLSEPRQPTSLAELEVIVQESHRVLDTVLELSRLLLKEPGNHLKVVEKVPRLFHSLVDTRAKRFRHYLRAGLGSAVELSRVLFESLIPVIIEYEKEGATWIDGTHSKRSTWYTGEGLMQNGLPFRKNSPEPILQFVDRLARERDGCWEKKRISDNPDVLDLGKGLPRGLPIQCLLPGSGWATFALLHPESAPFTSARLNQVLFSPYDVLSTIIPDDDGLITSLDSLKDAISAHIGTGDSPEERVLRAEQVAGHYSKVLENDPRRDYFLHRLKGLGLSIIPEPSPPPVVMTATYLDDNISVGEVVEWSPPVAKATPPPAFEDTRPKAGRITLLDLRMNQNNGLLRNKFSAPREPKQPSVAFSDLWPSPRDWKRASLQSREAIALSAILLLDTLTQQRVIRRPFPHGEIVRYPSIYLDDEFVALSRKDRSMDYVLDILGQFLHSAPPTLLSDLASSLLESISASEPTDKTYRAHFGFVVKLVKLMTRCDKPALAVDFFLKIVLEFPGESSYHRHLRFNRLGSRLRPGESISLVRRFAGRVCDGLRQQAQRVNAPNEMENKTKTPYIKVTTGKYVARLLSELEFVPPKISLEILQELFTASSHIDIKVAVVSSVLHLLERGDAREDSYQTLITLASSVAGPTERKEVTDEDWVSAENGGPLPQIDSVDDRPLLDLFISDACSSVPEKYRADYVEKVVIRLLDESTRQHTRWIHAFLANIGFPATIDISSFPFGPFAPNMATKILNKFMRYLPPSFLSRHRELVSAYTQHPLLDAITDCLASHSSDFRRTNEGKHWMECLTFYRDPSVMVDFNVGQIKLEPLVPDGITIHHLLTENCARASVMARHPFLYVDSRKCVSLSQSLVTNPLEILRKIRDKFAVHSNEEEYTLIQATIEKVAEDLQSLRSEKQLDSLVVFPSPLQIKSYLLPSPTSNPTVQDPLAKFVDEFLALLRVHSSDPMLVTEFGVIEKIVNRVPKKDARACAILLGHPDATEDQSVYSCLRAQLAQSLLSNLNDVDPLQDDELRGMIQRWKRSSCRFIRGIGWKIDGGL